MNQLETGEASGAVHGNSDLQKKLAEALQQRAAISAVLRAIANSPNDLQPIFDTVLDSAAHLCRADGGALRLPEETGFRRVAKKEPSSGRDVCSGAKASATRQFYGSPLWKQVAGPHPRLFRTS